jgi:hypothetical protein
MLIFRFVKHHSGVLACYDHTFFDEVTGNGKYFHLFFLLNEH